MFQRNRHASLSYLNHMRMDGADIDELLREGGGHASLSDLNSKKRDQQLVCEQLIQTNHIKGGQQAQGHYLQVRTKQN